MALLLGIIVVLALGRAAIHGLDRMIAKGHDRYRAKRDEWASRHPGAAASTEAFGRRAASAAAIVATTPFALGTFWRAAREEYPRARDRYRQRWASRTAPVSPPPAGAATPPPPTAQTPTLAPTQPAQPVPQPERTPPVTAPAATAEITNIQSLRAWLLKKRDLAVSEIDDTNAALMRAREDVAEAQSVADQAAAVFDQDRTSAAAVALLVDPYQARVTALEAQMQRCEDIIGQIDAALTTINARHSAVEEAHASAPHASERQAYQPA